MPVIFVVRKKVKEDGQETLYSAHNSQELAKQKIQHDFPHALPKADEPLGGEWNFESALFELEIEEVYLYPTEELEKCSLCGDPKVACICPKKCLHGYPITNPITRASNQCYNAECRANG